MKAMTIDAAWTFPNESGQEPVGSVLSPRARGRASTLSRLLLDAAGAVAEAAQLDIQNTPFICASALGEMETTLALLATITAEARTSPLRFQQSVHNTACGLWSIAGKQTAPSMAIAAGANTPAMALMEAYGWLAQHGGSIIVTMADEASPDPLWHGPGYLACAAGFALSAMPPASPRATLHRPRPTRIPPTPLHPTDDPTENPCAPATHLARAALANTTGQVALGDWSVALEGAP